MSETIAAAVEGLDAALRSVRALFHATGAAEVLTPVVCDEVAIEPFIEPVRAGAGFLRTSPELEMKRLLAHGAGDLFQVAPVSRKDERGRWHRPQFHLIEWYRHTARLEDVMGDVQALIAGVRGVPTEPAPRISMVERLADDLGIEVRGDESAQELVEPLASLRARIGLEAPALRGAPEVLQLAAWTELHSLWADHVFEPWLVAHGPPIVHLCEFPAPLAALSRTEGGRAARFETYVDGVELANGYFELADEHEQRRRFTVVNALRQALGDGPLPMPEVFLRVLEHPGLPPCCGAAMGLERLVALSKSKSSLDDVLPEPIP